jgi:hypothetical protein
VKVKTAKAGLSRTFRGSGFRRRRVSEAEHPCTGAPSRGDPLTDGRRVERVQWRSLLFVEALVGLVRQQAPAHEQAYDSAANKAEERFDFLVGGADRKNKRPLPAAPHAT